MIGFLTGLLDWRLVAAAVGAMAQVLVMPLAAQIQDRPENQGQHPDGSPPDPDAVLPDYTWREAMRSRPFWLLVVGDGCLSAVGMASLLLAGIDEFQANESWGTGNADTARMMAPTAAILVCDLIADRFPVRDVLAGLTLVLAGALAILMVGSAVSDFAFEALLGIALGGGQAVRIAARGIYFGRNSFATIAATAVLLVLPFQIIAIPSLHNLYELSGGTTIPL